MQSPQKIAGPALQGSPFQQLRSVSTDGKGMFHSPKQKEIQSNHDLMKKIINLLEENEKQGKIIQQLTEQEGNLKVKYQERESDYQLETQSLRRNISQLQEEREIFQAMAGEEEQRRQLVQEEYNEILSGQEEHIKQLLEQNKSLSEEIRFMKEELAQIDQLDGKIDFILYENEQLKDLNDRLQCQLGESEQQLMKFKQRIEESQETERNDKELVYAKQRIRNLETKLKVLSEDNGRRAIQNNYQKS